MNDLAGSLKKIERDVRAYEGELPALREVKLSGLQ
jgi:hypothetical protein